MLLVLIRPSDRRGPGRSGAAMCVQDVDVQCVLQFTLVHAAGCALHRHTSQVIHRLELSDSYRPAEPGWNGASIEIDREPSHTETASASKTEKACRGDRPGSLNLAEERAPPGRTRDGARNRARYPDRKENWFELSLPRPTPVDPWARRGRGAEAAGDQIP